MKNFIHIDSLDIPELQPYRTLRRAVEHVKQGIFVAEGEKVVKRLLKSDLKIISLLLTEKWLSEISDLIESKPFDDVKIFTAEKRLLDTIVGFGLHQGIMAVGKIPIAPSISEITQKYNPPYFFVAVDGLTNSDNLGVIVRNCAAFGVSALIVGETSSSPFLRRSVRMSMGAVFELPAIHTKNLSDTLKELSDKFNVRCIAADAHRNEIKIEDTNYDGNICIVFGSEGFGIRNQVLDACSEFVTIPNSDRVDSLNVASASAIFLWEVNRRIQHRKMD